MKKKIFLQTQKKKDHKAGSTERQLAYSSFIDMDVSQPPPQLLTAPSALATNYTSQPPPSGGGQHYRHHYNHQHHGSGKHGYNQFKPFMPGGFQRPFGMSQDDFDGKRLRKSVMRKTVDYNASIIKALEVTFCSQLCYKFGLCYLIYLFLRNSMRFSSCIWD